MPALEIALGIASAGDVVKSSGDCHRDSCQPIFENYKYEFQNTHEFIQTSQETRLAASSTLQWENLHTKTLCAQSAHVLKVSGEPGQHQHSL